MTIFMIRTTQKPKHYYWYVGTMRCTAVLANKALTISCPDSIDMVASEDSGDVSLKINNEVVATYAEGSIFHSMYRTILKHDSKN